MKKLITVKPDGTMHFIYDDRLRGLMSKGEATIKRASLVEPTPDNQWTADMSPSGGPVLGPYPCREAALRAEVEWLNCNRLSVTGVA